MRALRNLVAGAVPDLKPEKVTVVDERGKLLAGADDGEEADQAADNARTQTEERIRKTVKDLVEGVVGAGRARVQVSADLDLSRVTTQEENYDPDGQVVRSTQRWSNSKQNNSKTGDAVGASQNVPGQSASSARPTIRVPPPAGPRRPPTTKFPRPPPEIQEPGTVKRLSVAVAVDGVTTFDAKGKPTYTPRSNEEMQRIDQLVPLGDRLHRHQGRPGVGSRCAL